MRSETRWCGGDQKVLCGIHFVLYTGTPWEFSLYAVTPTEIPSTN
jgi:hypothetical protein